MFKFKNDWANVTSSLRNELVFENRNKNYGAYQIRKNYNNKVTVSLMVVCFTFLFLVSIPKLCSMLGLFQIDIILNKQLEIPFLPIDYKVPIDIPKVEPMPKQEQKTNISKHLSTFIKPEVRDNIYEPIEDLKEIDTQKNIIGDTIGDLDGSKNKGLLGLTLFEKETEDPPLFFAEEMPEFPGGIAKLYKYISNNVKFSEMEKERGVNGTISISFVIGKDGTVRDVKLNRGIEGAEELTSNSLKVVAGMPVWRPGKQNGKNVSVQYSLPIKFNLK